MPEILLDIDYFSVHITEYGWFCWEAPHVKSMLNQKIPVKDVSEFIVPGIPAVSLSRTTIQTLLAFSAAYTIKLTASSCTWTRNTEYIRNHQAISDAVQSKSIIALTAEVKAVGKKKTCYCL